MPVYNSAGYLRAAMDSLLCQTYRDFEVLAIDDGSQDESMSILSSYQDSRIRVYQNAKNSGIPATLNRGLDLARGRYVARMDADDVSRPERFFMQVAYLDAHPEVGLLGTRVRYLGAWKNAEDERLLDPKACSAFLLFGTPVAHPSVMIRKSVLEKHGLSYDDSFSSAQDYELWSRMAEVCRLANLPRVLLDYRMHGTNISTRTKAATCGRVQQVAIRQLARLGIKPTEADLKIHMRATGAQRITSCAELMSIATWLTTIRKANGAMRIYTYSGMDRALAFVWARVIMNCGNLGFAAQNIAKDLEFSYAWRPGWKRRIWFFFSMAYHQGRV